MTTSRGVHRIRSIDCYRDAVDALTPQEISLFLAAQGWSLEKREPHQEFWRLAEPGGDGLRGRIRLPIDSTYVDFGRVFLTALHAIGSIYSWSGTELVQHVAAGTRLTDGVTTAERLLLTVTRMLSRMARHNAKILLSEEKLRERRFCSPAELLLTCGRLFTPAAMPLAELGEARECFHNASDYSDRTGAIYVEGYGLPGGYPLDCPHAWCADGDRAIEPTWNNAAAYLGVPLRMWYRRERQLATRHWTVLFADNHFHELLVDGLPEGAVMDVGRPLPSVETMQAWDADFEQSMTATSEPFAESEDQDD